MCWNFNNFVYKTSHLDLYRLSAWPNANLFLQSNGVFFQKIMNSGHLGSLRVPVRLAGIFLGANTSS